MPIKDWAEAQAVAMEILSLTRKGLTDQCECLWEVLLRWIRKEFSRIMGRIISDCDLREDALQEALLNVYQGISTYDVHRSFKTWAEHVAVHAAYRVLKRRQRICEWEMQEPAENQLSDDEPCLLEDIHADPVNYQEVVIQRERACYLLECARRVLGKEELVVFEAIVFGETSYEELSRFLGKRADALRQQFLRAREKTLAAAVLHPHIFSNEEILESVDACQQSENPLNERELKAIHETLCGNPHRKPPSYRNTQHFRNACMKLAPYLLRYLVTLMLLLLYSVLVVLANPIMNNACTNCNITKNNERSPNQSSGRSL